MQTDNTWSTSLRAVTSKSRPHLRQYPRPLLLKKLPCVLGRRIHCSVFSVFSGGLGKELACINQPMGLEVGDKKRGLVPSIFSLLHFNALFSGFGSRIPKITGFPASTCCFYREVRGGQYVGVNLYESLQLAAPKKRLSRPKLKIWPWKKARLSNTIFI